MKKIIALFLFIASTFSRGVESEKKIDNPLQKAKQERSSIYDDDDSTKSQKRKKKKYLKGPTTKGISAMIENESASEAINDKLPPIKRKKVRKKRGQKSFLKNDRAKILFSSVIALFLWLFMRKKEESQVNSIDYLEEEF